MSTRSYICMERDGKYVGVYCHCDGYPTHNGAILLDFYQDRAKVERLIKHGDMSVLGKVIDPNPNFVHSFGERQEGVCVFYERDRGEVGCDAHEVKLEELDEPKSCIDYVYIYTKDNKWKCFACGQLYLGLLDLEEVLNAEYRKLGFPRRKGEYGYFTETEIAERRATEQAKTATEPTTKPTAA